MYNYPAEFESSKSGATSPTFIIFKSLTFVLPDVLDVRPVKALEIAKKHTQTTARNCILIFNCTRKDDEEAFTENCNSFFNNNASITILQFLACLARQHEYYSVL